jgi:hypothetical protein
MSLISPATLGNFLIEGVRQIDQSCSDVFDAHENGLVNVKRQHAAKVLAETGRKLTEELLIAYRLAQQLRANGIPVKSEHPYPGSREKCDLVVTLENHAHFWVEVKNAWKHWFNCNGTSGTSSAYKGYLFGDASHPGTAHDFGKLERVRQPDAHWHGVLLIGFDSDQTPMAKDIQELMDKERLTTRGWTLAAKNRWSDRRNPSFGIATWFWSREA